MFKTTSENTHYLMSQRLLALAEVAKVTSYVLLNQDGRISENDFENAKEAYQSAIQDINYIFKHST